MGSPPGAEGENKDGEGGISQARRATPSVRDRRRSDLNWAIDSFPVKVHSRLSSWRVTERWIRGPPFDGSGEERTRSRERAKGGGRGRKRRGPAPPGVRARSRMAGENEARTDAFEAAPRERSRRRRRNSIGRDPGSGSDVGRLCPTGSMVLPPRRCPSGPPVSHPFGSRQNLFSEGFRRLLRLADLFH